MAKRKPNIVDILIIVVVVALCAVAVFKFGVVNQKESAGVNDSEEQRTYTALIDEVRMATVNALKRRERRNGNSKTDRKYLGNTKIRPSKRI